MYPIHIDILILHAMLWIRTTQLQDVDQYELKRNFN